MSDVASEKIEQILIERLKQGLMSSKIVYACPGLMWLCLCVLGPTELSRGDLFQSQELKTMLRDFVISLRSYDLPGLGFRVSFDFCVWLLLPGVLDPNALMNLKKKGRATEWMPSFMCLRPMRCKAPDTWIMPSANFHFRCDHAPASPPGGRFCFQCKAAQTTPHIADFVDSVLRNRHRPSQPAPRRLVARSRTGVIRHLHRRLC